MSFSRFWYVIDHILFFCNAFEVWLCICWWHKTIWQNSDEKVMQQWSNSDTFDLGSFMSFARFWDVMGHIVSCCNALGVCLKNSEQTLMRQWWNSDATVMQQWWNSDAFDLSFITLFSSFWDVIDHILSFCNALGVCLVTKDPLTKTVNNSDATVMQQWCNSDGSVMPLIWALSHYFQAFEMSLIIIYPFAMPWECVWWHKTIWKNSDQTVMRQWWNSDATVIEQWCLWFEQFDVTYKLLRCHWSYLILLQCLGIVFGNTRPFDNYSDLTVMRQLWNSDVIVIEQWCIRFEQF
jgi:hypothetical protein